MEKQALNLPNCADRYDFDITVTRRARGNNPKKEMVRVTYPDLKYASVVDMETAVSGMFAGVGREIADAMDCPPDGAA